MKGKGVRLQARERICPFSPVEPTYLRTPIGASPMPVPQRTGGGILSKVGSDQRSEGLGVFLRKPPRNHLAPGFIRRCSCRGVINLCGGKGSNLPRLCPREELPLLAGVSRLSADHDSQGEWTISPHRSLSPAPDCLASKTLDQRQKEWDEGHDGLHRPKRFEERH